ncbi:MAG: hypothetical protein ABIH34_07775 [Nanoarchaeota archaeon]
MEADTESGVTKKTIAVLLVITIFVSLIGTWVFLNAIEARLNAQFTQGEQVSMGTQKQDGNVLITIHNPGFEAENEKKAPKVSGNVILTITN